jgi:hypothetical protein
MATNDPATESLPRDDEFLLAKPYVAPMLSDLMLIILIVSSFEWTGA